MRSLVHLALMSKNLITVLLVGSFACCTSTYAAYSYTFPVHLSVLLSERMTVPTQDIPSSHEWASTKIHDMRYGFQVFRVDTISDSTRMVNLQSFRHESEVDHVRRNVSRHGSTLVEGVTIPFITLGSGPQPARFRLLDFSPERMMQSKFWAFRVVAGTTTVETLAVCGSKKFLTLFARYFSNRSFASGDSALVETLFGTELSWLSERLRGIVVTEELSTTQWTGLLNSRHVSPPCDIRLVSWGNRLRSSRCSELVMSRFLSPLNILSQGAV